MGHRLAQFQSAQAGRIAAMAMGETAIDAGGRPTAMRLLRRTISGFDEWRELGFSASA